MAAAKGLLDMEEVAFYVLLDGIRFLFKAASSQSS